MTIQQVLVLLTMDVIAMIIAHAIMAVLQTHHIPVAALPILHTRTTVDVIPLSGFFSYFSSVATTVHSRILVADAVTECAQTAAMH